jgi:hypothetical protein
VQEIAKTRICPISILPMRDLMLTQMASEWALAHARKPTWNIGDPPKMGTYLTTCINGDGAKYLACHYWHNEWHSAGPFVRVLGWMHPPDLMED